MTTALKQKADWHIPEDAPLPWLVSLLFTRDFWNPLQLTQGKYNFFGDGESSSVPPAFKSFEDIYQAAAAFVATNPDASACYEKALAAIEDGSLAYVAPEHDEWGEKIGFKRDDEVDSYGFLVWAEKQYPLPAELVDAAHYIVMQQHYRKEAAEKEAWSFPAIAYDQFERKRQEPLWRVGTAILYLIGRRSRRDGKEHEYKGDGGLFDKLLTYVRDANTSHILTLAAPDYVLPKVPPEKDDHPHQHILDSKVSPEQIIAWAKTLPLVLPMLGATTSSPTAPVAAPAHCTPDMALMFDAITKFWSHYNLANPNPSIAPVKKDVVAWLLEEAAKRGLSDFSESRAKVLDTIMRCPEARKGGNTL